MSKSRMRAVIAPLIALGVAACATSAPVADMPYAAAPVGPPGPDDTADTCCYYDGGLGGFVDFDGGWYRTWNRGWSPWHHDPDHAPWHDAGLGRRSFGDAGHGHFALNSAGFGLGGFGHSESGHTGLTGLGHAGFGGLGRGGFGGFSHGGFGGGHGGR